jgi:predicted ATPase
LDLTAILHLSRRDGRIASERVEAAIALSKEQGFSVVLSVGMILRGWVLAEQGELEEGIVQMGQGLDIHQATGASVIWRPSLIAPLAEAAMKAGQAKERLTMLAEAMAIVNKTEKHNYEAELYRLKGELLLKAEGGRRRDELSPEDCFLKAIDIARQQEAKSLELRAVMSLSRLWRDQGKKKEARPMLAEIYGWFTEGIDTGDLKEAKALLEALS